MGYWFGKYSKCTSWRKTPTKVGKSWYTPNGQKVHNPRAYFSKIDKNGKYWKGNTGWKSSNKNCNK